MGSRSAFIVPMTAGNRARRDPNEGREASRGENQWRDTREGTMDPANLLTKRHWIVELPRKKPGEVLSSLHHVIDFEWMREAYWLTRKDGATGWRKWLARRTRSKRLPWDRFNAFLARHPLPPARIVHRYAT